MDTVKQVLYKVTGIVEVELAKYLSDENAVADIQAENLPGPDGEDYIHVNVVLRNDYAGPDAQKVIDFIRVTRPVFKQAGIDPIPVISYSRSNELVR